MNINNSSGSTEECKGDDGYFLDEDEDLYWKYAFPTVGVGGIGTGIVDRLHALGLSTSLLIAIDADRENLERVCADVRIHIGGSLLNGCGGNSMRGRLAADAAKERIGKFLDEANLTFIVAGIGGGTGAGAAPVVGQTAKKFGAVVIGVALVPFYPGPSIPHEYQAQIWAFMQSVDSLIIIESNHVRNYIPDASEEDILAAETYLVARTLHRWIRMMTGPSLVNIKVSDIRSIFRRGSSVMCYGNGSLSDGPEAIARDCLAHPLCSRDILSGGVDLYKARSGLVFYIGGEDMMMRFGDEVSTCMVLHLPGIQQRFEVLGQYFIRSDREQDVQVFAFFSGMGPVPHRQEKRKTALFGPGYTPYR